MLNIIFHIGCQKVTNWLEPAPLPPLTVEKLGETPGLQVAWEP